MKNSSSSNICHNFLLHTKSLQVKSISSKLEVLVEPGVASAITELGMLKQDNH
jgi:hypothetical protein